MRSKFLVKIKKNVSKLLLTTFSIGLFWSISWSDICYAYPEGIVDSPDGTPGSCVVVVGYYLGSSSTAPKTQWPKANYPRYKIVCGGDPYGCGYLELEQPGVDSGTSHEQNIISYEWRNGFWNQRTRFADCTFWAFRQKCIDVAPAINIYSGTDLIDAGILPANGCTEFVKAKENLGVPICE